jgi:large subunit ribosomal protein L30
MNAATVALASARVLAVTLVRSPFHHKPNICLTLKSMGLTKKNQTVYQKNLPSVRGKLNVIKHLVVFQPIP